MLQACYGLAWGLKWQSWQLLKVNMYCKFVIIIINILTYCDTLGTLETGRVQKMEGSNKKDRACHLVPIFIMITH